MTGEFMVAVHALVYLNHKACSQTSEEIAANVCTNPARVRKVMAKLKKAGLISTREGAAHGGYACCLKAQETTLLQILQAVDEKIIHSTWQSGNADMNCLIASGMADIMNSIMQQMDDSCREILQAITIADIEKQIFGEPTTLLPK